MHTRWREGCRVGGRVSCRAVCRRGCVWWWGGGVGRRGGGGGCPVHCGMFGSILGLCPPDVSSALTPPIVTTNKVSRLSSCPGGRGEGSKNTPTETYHCGCRMVSWGSFCSSELIIH